MCKDYLSGFWVGERDVRYVWVFGGRQIKGEMQLFEKYVVLC